MEAARIRVVKRVYQKADTIKTERFSWVTLRMKTNFKAGVVLLISHEVRRIGGDGLNRNGRRQL